MSRYRKKPVVIEAFRLGFNTPPDWYIEAVKKGIVNDRFATKLIETLEGEMRAEPGDYIIKGVKGELYPCKADIFDATYEAAE